MQEASHLIVILAGPNGAGKSTFYEEFLSSLSLPFINADRLAFDQLGRPANTDDEALAAAKQAEIRRHALIKAKDSFIFETVLSDSKGAKIDFLRKAQARGYYIEAYFIGLSDPMLSQARVIQRVDIGGHDVPDEKLAARFPRTLENLRCLIDVADHLTLLDNSKADHPFRKIAVFERGQLRAYVPKPPAWIEFLDLPSRQLPNTQILPE